MSVKLSIIIPVYNASEFIAASLDSLLSQTLRDVEIICVNDGSTDKSLDILREYEKNDSRIIVIDQPNQTAAVARNNGLDIAKGEFVMFMDADDWYPDVNVWEMLYTKAKENSVKAAGGSLRICDNDNNPLTFLDSDAKMVFEKEQVIDYRDWQFDYGYTRFIFDRQMIEDNNIRFPVLRRFQDPPFFVKVMICAGRFYATPSITYCYRLGHQNLEFNYAKSYDLLRGYMINMKLAHDNDLPLLYYNTIKRIDDSRRLFYKSLIKPENRGLLNLLCEANSLIDRKFLQDNGFDISDAYVLGPIDELAELCLKFESMKEKGLLKLFLTIKRKLGR